MDTQWVNKRTLLGLLLISMVLAGAGAGILDQFQTPNDMPDNETETGPGTPTVSVTPPATETPDTETTTESGTSSVTDIPGNETPTESPSTTSPTATPTEGLDDSRPRRRCTR